MSLNTILDLVKLGVIGTSVVFAVLAWKLLSQSILTGDSIAIIKEKKRIMHSYLLFSAFIFLVGVISELIVRENPSDPEITLMVKLIPRKLPEGVPENNMPLVHQRTKLVSLSDGSAEMTIKNKDSIDVDFGDIVDLISRYKMLDAGKQVHSRNGADGGFDDAAE